MHMENQGVLLLSFIVFLVLQNSNLHPFVHFKVSIRLELLDFLHVCQPIFEVQRLPIFHFSVGQIEEVLEGYRLIQFGHSNQLDLIDAWKESIENVFKLVAIK